MNLNSELEQELATYVSSLYSIDCKLGTNPFGPPKFDSFMAFGSELSEYYSYRHLAELANLVAKYASVNPENITFTNGSMGALELVFNKVLSKNDKTMLGIGPQFVEAVSEFKVSGGSYASLNMFDYSNEQELFAALCDRIKTEQPTLVYIDNPNNPTGRIYSKHCLTALCRVCQRVGTILMVDEAYGEYLDQEQSMLSEINHFTNLLVLRSFSKGLGMAGLRLGYVVSSNRLSQYLHSSVVPFAPSLASIKIATSTMPNIHSYLAQTKAKTRRYKAETMRILMKSEVKVIGTSSQTPILLAYKPETDLEKWFADMGIKVACGSHFRASNAYVNENYARIRIVGNERDLWQFEYRLTEATKSQEVAS